jgi:hypothetical protein
VVSGVVIYPGFIPHNNAVQKLLPFINDVSNAWERQSHMESFEMVCHVLWHPACTHFSLIQFAMDMLCSVPITMSVLSGKGTCMTQWMCMGMWVTAHCQYLSGLTDSTAFLRTSTIWWLTSTSATPFTCKNRYHTVYFDI